MPELDEATIKANKGLISDLMTSLFNIVIALKLRRRNVFIDTSIKPNFKKDQLRSERTAKSPAVGSEEDEE
jgi:hypothetical protein